MNLTIFKTNLDGIPNVQLTESIEKGDFITVKRDDPEKALYKVNSIEAKDLSLGLVKFFTFPKEVYLSYEEHNIVIGNKKYYVKDKLSKGQKIEIENKFYEIKDIIKIDKVKKELIIEQVETKKLIQVYTVKKTNLELRNKIGQFQKEEIALFDDYADALIFIAKQKAKNKEKNICYSL